MTNRFWILLVTILALLIFAALFLRLISETGQSNSYSLLAEAFLKGQFFTTQPCFDIDCVKFAGKTYVIFPPLPAVLIMPLIAIFGVEFSAYIFISTILFLLSGLLWYKIIRFLGKNRQIAFLFAIAATFATPIFYTTIRGDRVWFFAQNISFFAISLALYLAIKKKNAFLVGTLIAISFLSRQLTILLTPFIFALMIEDDLPFYQITRERIIKFVNIAIPVAISIIIYLSYNYLRFGDMFETGYRFLIPPPDYPSENFLSFRLRDLGIFNSEYFLFNLYYLFLQGFHVNFIGQYATELGSMDRGGTALLAASPFLFLLALTPVKIGKNKSAENIFSLRIILIGIITIILMIIPMLFYHSNGFTQYNVQRYVLDWLPIALIFLATALKSSHLRLFAALISYSLLLNIATLITVFLTS